MTSPSPIRLGVVGPGIQWRGHRDLLATLPELAVVTAVAARKKEKAEAEAKLIGEGVVAFDDWKRMLSDGAIDAVVVTTPILLNGPVTEAALRAGKDVFVEKPFCASVAEARKIQAAERETGRHVYILENLLFSDSWDKLKAIWTAGHIGQVAMFDRAMHHRIAAGGDPWGFGDTSWRLAGEFPLGPLFDGGVHELAVQARLFGSPRSVYAMGQKFRPEHGEFDNICAMVEYDSGVIGHFTHSGFLGGDRNYFHVRGTAGLIRCEYHQATVEPIGGKPWTVEFAPDLGVYFSGLAGAMWRELLGLCMAGKAARYDSNAAATDIATLEAIERSIRNGTREEVKKV